MADRHGVDQPETVTDPSGTTFYSAAYLAGLPASDTSFASVLINDGGICAGLAFGTDGSLTITRGWDDVTGYGMPNMAAAVARPGATAVR